MQDPLATPPKLLSSETATYPFSLQVCWSFCIPQAQEEKFRVRTTINERRSKIVPSQRLSLFFSEKNLKNGTKSLSLTRFTRPTPRVHTFDPKEKVKAIALLCLCERGDLLNEVVSSYRYDDVKMVF